MARRMDFTISKIGQQLTEQADPNAQDVAAFGATTMGWCRDGCGWCDQVNRRHIVLHCGVNRVAAA